MKYHKVVYKILDLLKAGEYWYETFEHEPVTTSEEAAKLRDGYTLHQGAKAMIVRVKVSANDKKFVMLVLPGDRKFDNYKVKKLFNAQDIRLASVEEINQITDGVEIGGVPPLGNLFGIEVVVDPELLENEKIIFNAGDRKFSVAMKSADYKKIVEPTISHITL